MTLLDDIFDDEKSMVTALGILKSSTSSDFEKFFKACVALLTNELEERLAALPPAEPEAPPADTGLTGSKTN